MQPAPVFLRVHVIYMHVHVYKQREEREGGRRALACAFAIELCLRARTSHLTKCRMFQLPAVSSTCIPHHFLLMRLDKL